MFFEKIVEKYLEETDFYAKICKEVQGKSTCVMPVLFSLQKLQILEKTDRVGNVFAFKNRSAGYKLRRSGSYQR